ncbi:MAG: DNA primase [Bacteroidetes bacterium CG2_30_32_10]|nr:MAG: DNA primase [Bacteroidetes bacterium CG2_30_32_10]
MINHDTIQNIIETSRIEEVVGDFVVLKKRGVNMIGLCPFHNEKTPSFTVSPAKGIYKCFGCGKAGNSINFIMEHEHYSYPEALKYLAGKYNIEIEEEVQTSEQLQSLNEKESLYNISAFAQKYFTENLFNSEEGKAIGYTYFKERDFSEETIKKFQLGYCIDKWDDFTAYALKNGYNPEPLTLTGLTIKKEEQYFDRFRGRVMFPIHNLSGRVIAFGGRILSSDKSKAKYVNSPESDIYHKSNVLYGLHLAKNAIISSNNCYLVEGYTDVISLHQAGVQNVVASSGTSLTTEQIRLIKRYTPNITILYDGDAAGIKASFRGIDMILEEGMNVKIILFTDGEDPDSFARKNRPDDVLHFIKTNAVDFINFKTNLLLLEASSDPIKKAELIKEIIHTIALIPEAINRSVYVKECSIMLNIPEQTVMNELNKTRRKKSQQKTQQEEYNQTETDVTEYTHTIQPEMISNTCEYQEKEIITFLLKYGNNKIELDATNEDDEIIQILYEAAKFIIMEVKRDSTIQFENKIYESIFLDFDFYINKKNIIPDDTYFVNHSNEMIQMTSINLLSFPYIYSKNWEDKKKIYSTTEETNLKGTIIKAINALRFRKLLLIMENLQEKIKNSTNYEESEVHQKLYILLSKARSDLAISLGGIVVF